jgi:hypothetical protein
VSSSSCAAKIATTDCATGYYVDDSTAADKVTAYSNSASFLTLFAPSNQAYTTDIVGAGGYSNPGDYYSGFGGTSAASPYAAGAAAVLQNAAMNKTGSFLTPEEVKSYLTTYGTTITDGKITSVQKPRIDLASAVGALPVTQPPVTVSASEASASEAGLTAGTFTFSRSGDTSPTLTVNYTVSGTATSGSDYTAFGTTVSFAAGLSTATKTVTPLQDSLIEADETIILTLASGTGYSLGTPFRATVTLISDDSNTVTVSASEASASEAGLTTGTFTFNRTGDTSAALTVNYTVSGTATAGSDYTALSNSVSFAAGLSTASKTVTPVQDSLIEADETIILTLASGTGYSLGNPSSATVTLTSDDSNTVTVSASDASASESGLTTGTFTFSRAGDTSPALTVNYTVSGTATSGGDYTELGTSVIFAAGLSTATKTVTPLQDSLVEADETVIITLASGTDYSLGTPSSATVTLASDEQGSELPTWQLNDTGIDGCTDASQNNLTCPVTDYPGQDAEYGRDVAHNDDSDGQAGFSFTKLDANGNPLPVGAASWSCVRDNVTGLIWEVKTDDGGLRDKDGTYTWYNPDATTNGGSTGTQGGGACTGSACDTDAFVQAVNAQGLCGASDWRLPSRFELSSIRSKDRTYPAMDLAYFPNTNNMYSYYFWSSSPVAYDPSSAWSVDFAFGLVNWVFKRDYVHVRLVRGGQ